MNPLIQLKITPPLLITLTLLCIGLLPKAEAVVPPPDGGYPGFNTAEGQNALLSLTTGSANTAVGWSSLLTNATGSFNTATGAGALLFNTANQNTAFGAAALLFNTTGGQNTAVGVTALLNNTIGSKNTANGARALLSNTTGIQNTASGSGALSTNTTGSNNTANGESALFSNTTGVTNTASGLAALSFNTIGSNNTAIGALALSSNTTGAGNTAIGAQALQNNTSGSFNIVLVGGQNLTTGDFNIDIGNDGVAGESNTVRIGNPLHSRTFIAGINGATVAGGTAVFINSEGQLGTTTSSARFKQDIQDMDSASEAILALRPVTFRYKPELDPKGIVQFGLVAEEVQKVNPDLIIRDGDGKPHTVRYEQINAMLLNEFLKAHRQIDAQQKQIDALTAGLQKVSAQLEANKPAPQMVKNTD